MIADVCRGTGNTGAQSWSPAYLQLLGKGAGGLGYDVCYVSPPPAMMGDVQVSLVAENRFFLNFYFGR